MANHDGFIFFSEISHRFEQRNHDGFDDVSRTRSCQHHSMQQNAAGAAHTKPLSQHLLLLAQQPLAASPHCRIHRVHDFVWNLSPSGLLARARALLLSPPPCPSASRLLAWAQAPYLFPRPRPSASRLSARAQASPLLPPLYPSASRLFVC